MFETPQIVMPSSASPQMPEPTAKVIFISHAGADKPRLGPYIEHLLDRTSALSGPIYVWIDRPGEVGWPAPGPTVGGLAAHPRVLGLKSAVSWNADIATTVLKSDCVIVIYSERAAPEKSSIFATEILTALFEKKIVAICLDPIRKPDKPDILLQYIQWTDVSRFVSTKDDGAFDRAVDQVIDLFNMGDKGCDLQVIAGPAIDMTKLTSVVNEQRFREIEILSKSLFLQHKIVDRKYISNVYIERNDLTSTLQRFAVSDGQTFALLGDAGMGKTSFLCAAANELGTNYYVMFYLAIELHDGLKSALQRDLHGFVGESSLTERLSMLAKEALRQGKRFMVFIDGLNEAPSDRQKLRAELNELARETEGTGLQWVISCRALDWDFWLRNSNNMIGRFGRSVWSERNDSTASAVVTSFNDSEAHLAWQKYRTEFKLVGHLSPQLRALCREPFMLRLVAEVYREGKLLPVDVDAIELFDRYFAERFPDQGQLFAVNKLLMTAAKRTLESGAAWIDVVDLSADDFALCQRLMHENVLVRRGETHLNFRFELVLEYLLAKWIVSTVPADAGRTEKVKRVLAISASPSVNVVGAIENILLLWQQDGDTVVTLVEQFLQLGDDRWKTMACSALRKLERLPQNASRAIEHLAADNNFIVRRYLVQTLARHASEVARIVRGLQSDVFIWERRETAANWFRWAQSVTPEVAISELVSLSDDPHWRVRRAAGYAMHARWSVDPSTRAPIAANLVRYSWRQRHSLCIGLMGSPAAAGTPEGDAVEVLSMDDNHQVRWLVANYLVRYVGAEMSKVLQRLATDADEWVRGRTASALISMDDEKRSAPAASAALQSLANDPAPAVRIRIARDLAKVAGKIWAKRILSSYLTDTPEVAFAAAYTLEGAPAGQAVDLFGDHAMADEKSQLWILRERIARGEVDPRTSRFSSLQEAISRVVELPAESDQYMRIMDSMTSLISAGADWLTRSPAEQKRFLELLCEDVDESVRWALVLYLSSFDDEAVDANEKLQILTRLAVDPHFWVRREVALAFERWGDNRFKDQKSAVLKRMWAAELASSEPCKDEVLHYLEDALTRLDIHPSAI